MHLGGEELEVKGVKNIFMNSEHPLLEMYTNENKKCQLWYNHVVMSSRIKPGGWMTAGK